MSSKFPNIPVDFRPVIAESYHTGHQESIHWEQYLPGRDSGMYFITGQGLSIIQKTPPNDLNNDANITVPNFTKVRVSIVGGLDTGETATAYTATVPAGVYFDLALSRDNGTTFPTRNRVLYSENGCEIRVDMYEKGDSYPYFYMYLKSGTVHVLRFEKIYPPDTPEAITVPDVVRAGQDVTINWTASTDPDGNLDGYIVERSYDGGTSWAQIYQGRATSTTTTIPFGTATVMFRVQAYDTDGAKSGWRTSANKTVVNNRAPAAPPSISVPLSPAGGGTLAVTWTASTDPDGNLEGYALERQWDGAGTFAQIYNGAALSYQDTIPKGSHSSVVYRVRAYDSFGVYSPYTTSPSRVIDNNTAPVITSDLSGDLGTKNDGFSVPYTVSDAEQQAVTVTEKVGDLVKRTYQPTLDQQNTFEVTGEYFQRILNGAQTVQIVATDTAGKSDTLSLTFTKAVHEAVITLSEPLAVEKQVTVAVLSITGDIPEDAELSILLTNNGLDDAPVWEDATEDIRAGRNHVFQNKTQVKGWAFNFKVSVKRGPSNQPGYIMSVQGGFQ